MQQAAWAALMLLMPLSGVHAAAHSAPADTSAVALVRGANQFAFDLYGRLAPRPGNLFFSPFSIHGAVAMAYAGARGATESAIAATMHYPLPPEQLGADEHELAARLMEHPVQGKPAFELDIANALWAQQGIAFEPSFTSGLDRDYGAGLRRVDFVSPGAREEINHWVAEATRDRIRDIIPPGLFDRLTRLVLVNAIYFHGRWESTFAGTSNDVFHLDRGDSIRVPMMERTENFEYLENAEAQILRLPYASGRASMILILPRHKDGLAGLGKKLDAATLGSWLAGLRDRRVEAHVPRFRLTDQFEIAKPLAAMGMAAAFGPKADFSGMSRSERLFVSAVLHKAYVAVDEKGTEAAAATAVVMTLGGAPPTKREPPVVFRADHPFLFLIRHDPTGAILFLGRVADPR
jgi:serpin B